MTAPQADPDRIVVLGRARRAVQPDVAGLTVVVVETDADQRAAFARCAERIDDLLPRLRDAAGAGATVSTGHVQVAPDYDDRSYGQPRGYATSYPVMVQCAPAAAARVVAEAVAAGINRLDGPGYWVRDPRLIVDELLAEAFADARRKALRLADAAGRELGAALAVEEGDGHRWSDADEGGFFDGSIRAMAASSGPTLDLEPGESVLAAAVRVTFALAPR
jgi:uncharacterized protein YggE